MSHLTSARLRPTRCLPPVVALWGVLVGGAAPHDTAAAQIVVENSFESAWATTTAWTLEEDLRIWGPPGGYLSMIVAVAADSRDHIYILDYVTQEIYVFDSGGGFLRTVGGQGDGPGEFRDALGPAIGPGDTLWVADQRAPRYSIFAPDGRFVGTRTRRGAPSGGTGTERCTMTPDGSYMDWWTRYPKEEISGDMSDIDLLHFHPLRVSPDGENQDTLPYLEFTQQMAEMPSQGARRPVLFGPGLEYALGCNDDVWFAHSGEYRLYRRSLEGDTTRIATLDGVTPPAVDEADRDEVRALFERRPNPAMMNDYLRTLPDKKPIIVNLFVDGAGHVFVVPETSRVDAGTAIDVFREDGVFLGRVAVPEAVNINPSRAYATGDYILFAGEDDAGTPYVTRLRIHR
ncbi:MAG: 6-bladed beta-propeller [Gemmatimonadetes bacterium]|nr:6-bladed beta-propeller [Gemmatimonadota bacterium]